LLEAEYSGNSMQRFSQYEKRKKEKKVTNNKRQHPLENLHPTVKASLL
jgi:hypothetical protein